MALVLMSTEACHLCEEAQGLLVQLQALLKVDVLLEDIGENEAQVERYGVRIPVLLHEETGAELDWPFDLTQLKQWLMQHQCLHSV